MGVDLMHEQLQPLGFGVKTGIDLEGEVTGILPSTAWKKRYYKTPEQQRWYAGETISLGIGQGYNNFTMLQLAQATATLVSGGLRFKPRLVRAVETAQSSKEIGKETGKETGKEGGKVRSVAGEALAALPHRPEHTELIRRALYGVTQEGTSTRVFLGAPYASGGKTGTAQAVGVKQNQRYDASKLEEHKRDHSLYIAAAPIDAPAVVLAVVVENAGFGSQAAAPIARRVFDYLLLGQYPSEEDMALTREGKSGAPVGTPRRAADMPLTAPAAAGTPVRGSTAVAVAQAAATAAPVVMGAKTAARTGSTTGSTTGSRTVATTGATVAAAVAR